MRGMSVAPPRGDESGFSLIEALVAVGILTVAVLCAMGAVTVAVRAAANGAPRAALTATAQNVLADLRAASAYDSSELAELVAAGSRRLNIEASQTEGPATAQTVTVAVAPNASGAGYTATVTVDDASGNTVTLRSTLVQEAPAPGSVIPLSSPPPAEAPPRTNGPAPGGCDPSAATCSPCLLGRGCRAGP